MARNSYVLNATSLDKSRSSWSQSKSHKTSIPFGKVVPLGLPIEVLPGDTFKLDMGAIIRSLTPKAPLMDSISGDVYAYFVPNRLIFDKSKQFFGQNESEAWTLNLNYTIPHIKFALDQDAYSSITGTDNYLLRPDSIDYAGGLSDHFELPFVYLTKAQYSSLPSTVDSSNRNVSLNALPYRGYQIIWNEDFRNPAVVDPVLTLNYDHSDVNSSLWSADAFKRIDTLLPVMRYRDLYSSSLKSPQRGPSATIPLGSLAPVIGGSSLHSLGDGGLFFETESGTGQGALAVTRGDLGLNSVTLDSSAALTSGGTISKTNLMVDLSSASAATVNTLRQSIAIQHLYEMMTNAFRYNEYTEVFFGVRGSDATLQRPQHLGGIHFRFNVNQVLSTSEGTNTTVGSTGAFGTAEIRGHVYTNSFTEHGLIFLLIVIRKEHTYCQGLDKFWRKREFLDIFQPPLAHIGNVDIKTSEVWFGFNDSEVIDDSAFGYTEPYYEYRYMQSKATGLMNPLAPGSLSFYSLTDVLSSKPSLNKAFVSEDPNGLDNALFASTSNVDQFFGDFYFRYQCTRVMPLYSVPGLNRI